MQKWFIEIFWRDFIALNHEQIYFGLPNLQEQTSLVLPEDTPDSELTLLVLACLSEKLLFTTADVWIDEIRESKPKWNRFIIKSDRVSS